MQPGISIKFSQVELVARTLVITKEDINLGGMGCCVLVVGIEELIESR